MALSRRVAKTGVVRRDGKCFSASALKMFAEESPEKYEYLEGPQELWLKKREKKKNVDISKR